MILTLKNIALLSLGCILLMGAGVEMERKNQIESVILGFAAGVLIIAAMHLE